MNPPPAISVTAPSTSVNVSTSIEASYPADDCKDSHDLDLPVPPMSIAVNKRSAKVLSIPVSSVTFERASTQPARAPLSAVNIHNGSTVVACPGLSRAESVTFVRKELITFFVSCTSLNLPIMPQSFFQSAFKKKKPDSAVPECRVEVDMRLPTEKIVHHHQATEPRRCKNPTFAMGFTIPIPIADGNSAWTLYFRVQQTDKGYEKCVADAEVTCSVLMESFRQGSPVVHSPLRMADSHEGVLSLTFGRISPVKHTLLPTQNMLIHMYSFEEKTIPTFVQQKQRIVATEELSEVGYASQLPRLFLRQAKKEINAAHHYWSVRYNNARKTVLRFDNEDDALANGCDVYRIDIIAASDLKVPSNVRALDRQSNHDDRRGT
jgi:hypothetical protein